MKHDIIAAVGMLAIIVLLTGSMGLFGIESVREFTVQPWVQGYVWGSSLVTLWLIVTLTDDENIIGAMMASLIFGWITWPYLMWRYYKS